MKKTLLSLKMVAVSLVACPSKSPVNLDEYGLFTVQLYVEPEDLAHMRNNINNKTPVAAEFSIDDKFLRGHIAPSGKSSLLKTKRSYDLFPFQKDSILNRSTYRLSSQANDISSLRSSLGFHIFELHGLDIPEQTPVAAYMNEAYMGLYYLIELVDADFYRKRDQAAFTLYKTRVRRGGYASLKKFTINHLDRGFSVRKGPKTYSDLKKLIEIVHADAPKGRTDRIENILDVENYLRYLSAAVYMKHQDGFENNFFIYRDTSSGKFKFTPWDLDQIFGRTSAITVIGDDITGEGGLSEALLNIPAYRSQYDNLLSNLANITAPYSVMETYVNEQANLIQEAFEADRVNRGAVDSFEEEKDLLLLYIQRWTDAVRAEI